MKVQEGCIESSSSEAIYVAKVKQKTKNNEVPQLSFKSKTKINSLYDFWYEFISNFVTSIKISAKVIDCK